MIIKNKYIKAIRKRQTYKLLLNGLSNIYVEKRRVY